jgi:hypothetical protein
MFMKETKMTKVKKEETKSIDEMIAKVPEKLPIDSMPLESLDDYMTYNREARRLNKKLGICRYQIKPCPIDLHPKERIVFGRNDQPSNPLSIYKSDDIIDFKMKLYPGTTYDLPVYIVNYLMSKGSPEWKWFNNPDGSRETRISNYKPRFAIRSIR